ncbi:MAG: hypothetical protein ACYS91_20240, partial [Planctomycetota bacterium]
MNVYEYVGSNPMLQGDPRGLWGIPIWIPNPMIPNPMRMIDRALCPPVLRRLRQLLAFRRRLLALGFPVAWFDGHPYQHCLWSCNMTRGVNRTYAKIMGKAKEALDDQVADW